MTAQVASFQVIT